MAIGLNAKIFNQLPSGDTLTFQTLPAVHGENPTAEPTSVPPDTASNVLAPPLDPVFGPSSEGSFELVLPNNAGLFLFQYNFHASPPSFTCQPPSGYTAQTQFGGDGQCYAALSQTQSS